MKIIGKKGAVSNIEINADPDSLVGKLIAGTKGKVTIRTPFGEAKIAKDKKKEKE